MGKAVPIAQSAADFVIQGDALANIAQAVVLARKTVRVVRQNLLWAAVYNFACIPLAMVGWLPAWLAGLGMATSSLLVVVNAMRLARVPPVVPAVEKSTLRRALPGADLKAA
jgi:Cu2+-exporting ATPase